MYKAYKVQISQSHPLYDYCSKMSHWVNNLYNAGLFRCRQVLTASKKDPSEWTANEKQVMGEVTLAFPDTQKKSLSYTDLEKVMRTTNNPDYFVKGFSQKVAQQTLKDGVAHDMKAFFASMKAYKANPSAFGGKPKLPHYKKKGGLSTVVLSNQACIFHPQEDGTAKCGFPYTKIECNLGSDYPKGRLMQTEIKPFHNIFNIIFIFDDGLPEPKPISETHTRICAIDFGVANTAAITNNVGLPCLLFKGGVMKSQNQWYNKQMAKIKSKQTKGTNNKFQPTLDSEKLCVKRENQVVDYIRKVSKQIVAWCADNKIDTIVLGHTKYWKDESNIGHKNNQEFVQFPIGRLQDAIRILASVNGICVVDREESYTSKASFLDNDYILTYGVDDQKIHFSGRRIIRGLYKSADGTVINADLNGSANILRKEFSNAFIDGLMPDFNNVIVIRHPDYENRKENQKHQTEKNSVKPVSKSKLCRQKRKSSKTKVTPME